MLLAMIGLASAMTLEDAWARVEADGQETTLLTEQRRQAELYRTMAWATVSPKVSVSGNFNVNEREIALDFSQSFPPEVLDLIEGFTGEPVDFGDPTIIQEKDYFDANVTIVQPLFSAKAIPGLYGAQALARAGQAQEEAGRAQLRLGVARAFWGVAVAREGERVSTDALDVAKRYLVTAKALVAAGSATRQTELQAAIGVARAQRDLAAAVARRTQAEEAFAALVGVSDVGALDLPDGPRSLPVDDTASAVGRATDRRPDLRAAEEQLRAARQTRLATDLGWVPSLDGRFTQAWSENAGFSGANSNWMLVFTASWTPWDGGFRIAEQERTASVLRQATASVEKAREDVATEVRSAWEERERAQLALAAAREELGLAEENLRLAEISYEAGASAYLDLEQARVGRDAARLTVTAETMNLDLANLSMLKATGDL